MAAITHAAYQQALAELRDARDWIERVLVIYDRENVPVRRTGRGRSRAVRVSLPMRLAESGRNLLRPRAERTAGGQPQS